MSQIKWIHKPRMEQIHVLQVQILRLKKRRTLNWILKYCTEVTPKSNLNRMVTKTVRKNMHQKLRPRTLWKLRKLQFNRERKLISKWLHHRKAFSLPFSRAQLCCRRCWVLLSLLLCSDLVSHNQILTTPIFQIILSCQAMIFSETENLKTRLNTTQDGAVLWTWEQSTAYLKMRRSTSRTWQFWS